MSVPNYMSVITIHTPYGDIDLHYQAAVLTLCARGENHVGMQQVQSKAMQSGKSTSTSIPQLKLIQLWFSTKGISADLIYLNTKVEEEDAAVLYVKGGLKAFLANPNFLAVEIDTMECDRQYYDTRRKKVLNKHKRWNYVIADQTQQADIENKKGTIHAFHNFTYHQMLRDGLTEMGKELGLEALEGLIAEANIYHSAGKKCGIGFHGDEERPNSAVIGANFGKPRFIEWQSFHNSRRFGNPVRIKLGHGDMYFMSEGAVGIGWKQKSRYVFRHRAGEKEYLDEDDKVRARSEAKRGAPKPIKNPKPAKRSRKQSPKAGTTVEGNMLVTRQKIINLVD